MWLSSCITYRIGRQGWGASPLAGLMSVLQTAWNLLCTVWIWNDLFVGGSDLLPSAPCRPPLPLGSSGEPLVSLGLVAGYPADVLWSYEWLLSFKRGEFYWQPHGSGGGHTGQNLSLFVFLDEVGSKGDWEYWSQYWLLLYSESHLPRPSVAYRTCPSGSRAGWLTPLDEGLSPWHISSCPSLIWDSFWRRWCVHTSGRAVIFQSFWSQCLFTLLNYWGLQWVLVSAGYIYWYLSYNRDQQTLAYGPSLAHDCFFVKKNLVEHSQVHLFMYCLWFFRASLVAQMVKDWETCVWSLGWEDSLGGGHGNTL